MPLQRRLACITVLHDRVGRRNQLFVGRGPLASVATAAKRKLRTHPTCAFLERYMSATSAYDCGRHRVATATKADDDQNFLAAHVDIALSHLFPRRWPRNQETKFLPPPRRNRKATRVSRSDEASERYRGLSQWPRCRRRLARSTASSSDKDINHGERQSWFPRR